MGERYNFKEEDGIWKMYNEQEKECGMISGDSAENIVKSLNHYEKIMSCKTRRVKGKGLLGMVILNDLKEGEEIINPQKNIKYILE